MLFLEKENREQPENRLLKREFLNTYMSPYAAYHTNSRYGQKMYIVQIVEKPKIKYIYIYIQE